MIAAPAAVSFRAARPARRDRVRRAAARARCRARPARRPRRPARAPAACCASSVFPVSSKRCAATSPMRFATNAAICAGGRPSVTSGVAKRAVVLANTKSHTAASPTPPPIAAPSTTAIVGTSSAASASSNVPNARFIAAIGSGPLAGGGVRDQLPEAARSRRLRRTARRCRASRALAHRCARSLRRSAIAQRAHHRLVQARSARCGAVERREREHAPATIGHAAQPSPASASEGCPSTSR